MRKPYPKYHPPIDLPYAEVPQGRTWDVYPSPHQRLGKKEKRLWGAQVSSVPYAYEDPYLTSVQDTQYTVDTSQMHRYPYIRPGEDPGRMPMLFDEPFPAATTGSANFLDTFGNDGFLFGSDMPFQNRDEGNAFRRWVNENHPDWAQQNELSRSGSHTNSYIKKAWAEFGDEYSSGGKKEGFDLQSTIKQAEGGIKIAQQVGNFFSNIGKGFQKKKSTRKKSRSKRRSDAQKLGVSPFKLIRMMKKAKKGDPEAKAFLSRLKKGKKGRSINPQMIASGAGISKISNFASSVNAELNSIRNAPEPQMFSNMFAQAAENEKINVVQRIQSGQQVPLMVRQSQQVQQELTQRSNDLQESGEKLEKEKKKNNVLLYTSIGGGVTALGLLTYLILKK